MVAERPPRDRRRIAEGPSKGRQGYRVKIRKLRLFMGNLRNVLILKCYVIAAKKARRTHIEGSKKGYHQGIAERSPWFAVGLADKGCQ